VSGLTVHLTGTNEAHESVNLTTTGFNGSYSFTRLLPGVCNITITPPRGLRNDFTTTTGARDDITLGVDQTIAGLDFGLLLPKHHHHRGNHGEPSGDDH
jgi:hypothetical protein